MATYYVTTSGSTSNDGLSEQNAWTLPHAFANVVAGDIVNVKAGSYQPYTNLSLNASGTANNKIRFEGYVTTPGDITSTITTGCTFPITDTVNSALAPSLVGTTTNSRPDQNQGIQIFGNHIEFVNFQFYGYNRPFENQGSNNLIRNVKTATSGTHNPSDVGGFSTTFPTGAYTGYGIICQGDDNEIFDCLVVDAGAEGFRIVNAQRPHAKNCWVECIKGEGTYTVPTSGDGNITDYHFLIASNTADGLFENITIINPQNATNPGHGIVFKTAYPNGVSDIGNVPCVNHVVDGFYVENTKIETQFGDVQNITFRNGVLKTTNLLEPRSENHEANIANGSRFVTIENVEFIGTRCMSKGWQDIYPTSHGWMARDLTLRNCVFYNDNMTTYSPLGVGYSFVQYEYVTENWKIENCTFYNYSRLWEVDKENNGIEMTNCIVDDIPTERISRYNDGGGPAAGTLGPYPLNITYSHCNFTNGFTAPSGTNIYTHPPQFVNIAAYNFKLSEGSLCTKIGTNAVTSNLDFEGKERGKYNGTLYDLGAYEYENIVYADEIYGFTVGDSTKNYWDAILAEAKTGNTLVFRDMGSPWVIGAQMRVFDIRGLTVIFEPGCVFEKKRSVDGGYWEDITTGGGIRRYRGAASKRNTYPGGTMDPCEKCNTTNPTQANECSDPCGDYYFITDNPNGALFWWSRVNGITVVAHDAEFIGVYPYDNPGTNPATTAQARDFSYEFGHCFYYDQPGQNFASQGIPDALPNFHYGGWMHNMSGDGLTITDNRTEFRVEDIKCNYCKRLGFGHIHGPAKIYLWDSDLSLNGKADVSPVWGTNTRQGITIEPNNASETVLADYRNIRAVGNSSCGLGLNMGKVDNTAPFNIDMYFDGFHFDANSDQVDWSAASSIRWNGTDMFHKQWLDQAQTIPNPDWPDGDKPLPGTVVFKNIASWGDVEGFLYYRGYDGVPSWSFDNTVIYKMSTTGLQVMPGDAVNRWQGHSNFGTAGRKWQNFDWGNVLCIHELNEPFCKTDSTGQYNEVASSVTGTVTVASPNTDPVIVTPLTNNNTISKTQYTLGSFPQNVVSVQATATTANKADGTVGRFTFSRTGTTTWPTAVHYTFTTSGTNTEHMVDFKLLRGSVVIPAGATTATLEVKPITTRGGANGQIDLTITPKADLYTIDNSQATVFLIDDSQAPPSQQTPTVFSYNLETVRVGNNKATKYLGASLIQDRRV